MTTEGMPLGQPFVAYADGNKWLYIRYNSGVVLSETLAH